MPSAEIYLSSRDLGRAPVREEELVGVLRQISAGDCLVSLAHLSTRLFAESRPRESEHWANKDESVDCQPITAARSTSALPGISAGTAGRD